MQLAQIFILALCVLSVTMLRCYDESELEKKARQKLKKFPPPPNITSHRISSSRCPVELLANASVEHRSLSPWIYKTVDVPEYYPQKYSQAECLCDGCMISREGKMIDNDDYNSVQLKVSFVFMKRVKCKKGGYQLKPERQEVTVGCTCVRPQG